MKRILHYSLIFFAAAAVFSVTSCKKEKTREIYFSSTSGTINETGTITVNIELSEPSADVVEVEFVSTGATQVYFGGYEAVFMRDDSEKMEAKVDPHAFIDSAGHMRITPGTKTVIITINDPLKGDIFPHAASSFAIKMSSAVNAKIREGSDSYSLSIGTSDQDVYIAQDSTFLVNGSEYLLKSSNFKFNGPGNYNLVMNFAHEDGSSPFTITLDNVEKLMPGPRKYNLDCATANIGITGLGNGYDCSNLTRSEFTFINFEEKQHPYYGTYLDFYGNGKGVVINISGPDLSIRGYVSSIFYFDPTN